MRLFQPSTELIRELDDFEKDSLSQLESKHLWKVYLSGVVLPVESVKKLLVSPPTNPLVIDFENDDELSKALWLSYFSEDENFKRTILLQGLTYVQEKHEALYSELQQEHSGGSQGWFSSVVSKVGQWSDSIGRSFTSEIPSELNLQEVLSECIEEIPEEQRAGLFHPKK